MMLKPQDAVILLKLISTGGRRVPYLDLSKTLFMSVAEVHKGVKRLAASRLVDDGDRPVMAAAEEFLVHGLKYSFPAVRGAITRGLPTGFGAPPMKELIAQEGMLPPVWPDPEGTVRGYELEPMYSSAVRIARRDSEMYELLVLVDSIRSGGARERMLAEGKLKEKMANAPTT